MDEKLYAYVSEYIKIKKLFGLIDVQYLFIQTLKDFFEKIITIEELEYISCSLYFEFIDPNEFFNYNQTHEFGALLEACTDIAWYDKNALPGSKEQERLKALIKMLENYYANNKDFLSRYDRPSKQN